MFRKALHLTFMVLAFSGVAFGYEGQDLVDEYYIPIGIPVIDGNISPGEWDHANWLELDKLYYGDPPDLSDARWAALWSPETNLIYVVITGIDTDHVFGDGYWGADDWNKYDIAEVYFDPSNSDVNPYQQIQDPAQQWMSGNDTNEGRWIMLPVEWVYPENPLDDELRPEFYSTVEGDVYTYEYALTPYESFGWNTGRADKILQLEADTRVGIDVVMSSKSTSFGMLCENAWEADDDVDGDGLPDGIITITKWNYANRFLDHSLVKDPNQAWRPRPANKAVDVSSEVTLRWNAGLNAASHRVYFGASFEDVNDANESSVGIYRGPQALENTIYTPNEIPLELYQTYYWRIDEVNGINTWKGNIWRFRVTNYLIVEDFDSYEDDYALAAVWEDYWVNGTGSEVFISTTISRDGNSMEYLYGNNFLPYYSETKAYTADFEIGPDWSVYDIAALTLWFRGSLDNAVEQMYVELQDGDGNSVMIPYDGDANDVKDENWQEWNIDLQEFAGGGVALEDVNSISIVIGEKAATEPGGSGAVYLDDIRLYLSRCIPERAQSDFTGDCFTDFDDLDILAGDWLESDFFVDVNMPAGELIWYKFDNEGGMNTAVDSSGNGYDGTVSGAVWTTEGYIDGALVFDDGASVEVPSGAFTSVTTQITIAMWQYGDPYKQPLDDNLFEGTRDYSNSPGIRVLNAHLPWSNSIVYWDAGNPNDVWSETVYQECDRIEKEAEFDDYAGQWNHWTFIKNCDANDGAGEMKIYLNGFLWHSGGDANVPLTGTIDDFVIGSGYDASYAGLIDDFRVYDYELSEPQVAYLATVGTGYYPLQSRTANAYEDENIDFKDYAVMADNWLGEQLWP